MSSAKCQKQFRLHIVVDFYGRLDIGVELVLRSSSTPNKTTQFCLSNRGDRCDGSRCISSPEFRQIYDHATSRKLMVYCALKPCPPEKFLCSAWRRPVSVMYSILESRWADSGGKQIIARVYSDWEWDKEIVNTRTVTDTLTGTEFSVGSEQINFYYSSDFSVGLPTWHAKRSTHLAGLYAIGDHWVVLGAAYYLHGNGWHVYQILNWRRIPHM